MIENVDLEALRNAGWRARIKTVSDRKYITLRRKGKERSLGPYNEKLWNELEQLIMTPKKNTKVKSLTDVEKALTEAMRERGYMKIRLSTVTKRFDNWKKYPREELNKFRRQIKELDAKVSNITKMAKGVPLWTSDIVYSMKGKKTTTLADRVLFFEQGIEKLENKFTQIPIPTLHKTYKCRKCGNQEKLIALNIKCTQCKDESWWGWWPQQKDN